MLGGEQIKNRGRFVGFKSIHYSVMESAKKVDISIIRNAECPKEDYTFNVHTKDDDATAGEDYTAIDELVTLKAGENEKFVSISIVDDEEVEPDQDFFVVIADKKTKDQLDGDDTKCRVTIIDNDNPGTVGFRDREVTVRPKDQVLIVDLERLDGSSGVVEVEILVEAVKDEEKVLNGVPAKEGVDYLPLSKGDQKVVFEPNETKKTIRIDMPGTTVKEGKEDTPDSEEEADSAFFEVKIVGVHPEGCRLSRKKILLVEIRPEC